MAAVLRGKVVCLATLTPYLAPSAGQAWAGAVQGGDKASRGSGCVNDGRQGRKWEREARGAVPTRFGVGRRRPDQVGLGQEADATLCQCTNALTLGRIRDT